ncbi:MAG TPA: ABC-2 family transporter protein, partial [Kofleriaceae bacterium]|nr:ABC-2 family transporter protein [Kofleriaceae bacterium]
MDSLRLYIRYIAISIRAQLAYRVTFVFKTAGHMFVTAIEFLGIWALFSRFGTLAGWSLRDVALLYGMADIAFSLADGVGRGFDKFGTLLKAGDFDRMLVRPRSTVLQLLGYELQLMRIGRLSQGIVVLAWAGGGIAWSAGAVFLVALSIIGTACLFVGLVVLQATSCFWTIETLEVWNAFTYGGNYAGQYPMAIYRRWFQRFFTAVIPLALTSYYPARAILGRDEIDVWHTLAPLAGLAFLAISFGVWRIGVRHHAST